MSERVFGKAMRIGRMTRLPFVRRLILITVLCLLASLALTASTSAATLFTNPSQITIPDKGNASPYPSEISVSGLNGPITDVSVTLHRFGHAKAIKAGSINRNTFELFKAGTTKRIGATVSYDAMARRAILNPNSNLKPGTRYKAVVTTGAKDLSGNPLDQNPSLAGNQQKVWFFTTRN